MQAMRLSFRMNDAVAPGLQLDCNRGLAGFAALAYNRSAIMSTRPENSMTATTTPHLRPQDVPPQTASAEMPEVPLTTEGYSVLHQMMRFRWTAWRALPEDAKSEDLHRRRQQCWVKWNKGQRANPRFIP